MKTIELRSDLFVIQTSDRVVAAKYSKDAVYRQNKVSEEILRSSSVLIAWTAICKAINGKIE